MTTKQIKQHAKKAVNSNLKMCVLAVLLHAVILALAFVSLLFPLFLVFGVLAIGSSYLFQNLYKHTLKNVGCKQDETGTKTCSSQSGKIRHSVVETASLSPKPERQTSFEPGSNAIRNSCSYRVDESKVNGTQLFWGFTSYVKNLGLSLAKFVLCVAGLIALILPFFFVAARLMFMYNISNDNKDKSIRQCIDESWTMTQGYEKRIFLFSLSFIGWFLLCVATLGVMLLYVLPYYKTAKAGLYLSIKRETGLLN